MAIYEYECEIHNIIEVQQSIKDEPLILCPHCTEDGIKSPIKKLISTNSFALKGGGWGDTGYSGK